ncbi:MULTISPECIES: class I SAM-dependent methyltransferase [Clostridium]|uniref:S-adenosyl-L-methionine-dependent methyltransferase n=1 Tax=Clostridium beijerinckii TaxID=1520 RepID=A0AAW3WC82_CLOBE|nr:MULTISPECIES: class I SAM-dependent methyltransferase [Clostridium]AVK47268.1 methyltransferase [Clostridium sp. MF28]MBC2458549.1 class I SAM-dependent methyltransferase [Clostridium beijerinckii]MBC2476033.1 class I SAM-dependent methyltransferase [Clostridium beijerinckii]NOV60866.1 methyltransferase (TIGR00027 family) [Clostridium beijerinckii]NOV73044.1 methyltransferase (TIGR00027 family) [Clostridium beijerinckii]
MEQKSMTALISAFSRAYHSVKNKEKVFDDYLAKDILTQNEYEQISSNMSKGIKFFNPSFDGTQDEALRFIVDNQLSPTPIGRAAFTEKSLENAVKIGAKQYLIFAAGYDTFAYRQPDWARNIQIFELDHPLTGEDKQKRIQKVMKEIPPNLHYISIDFTEKNWERNIIKCSQFEQSKISFCSLLGLNYYLTKKDFAYAINTISSIVPKGSSIVFDYQDENTYTSKAGERVKKQIALTNATNEKMLASYSYLELEKLLSDSDFLIYEHLTPDEITEQYFKKYNQANPEHLIRAFDNVNYCLAVKK